MTLRAELKDACEPLKTEPEEVRIKVRALYKVALRAIELAEKLEADLAALKSPTFFEKKAAPIPEAVKDKRFYSRLERIQHFMANDPKNPAFLLFLKFNRISYEDAVRMAKGELIDDTTTV